MGRSSVVPPPLPPLDSRIERFDAVVADTAEYLRDLWPELREVHVHVELMPLAPDEDGIPRWTIDRETKHIFIFRLPVQRLDRAMAPAELNARMTIEATVFGAVGEYLGKDPWDLAPDRHRRW